MIEPDWADEIVDNICELDIEALSHEDWRIKFQGAVAAALRSAVESRDRRIQELEEALRPFADKSCAYAGSPDHHDGKCNIGDLRRARAALEKKHE